jgi:ribosomal protein L11 methyltransferase
MSSIWQVEIMRPGTLSPRAFDFFSDLPLPDQLGCAAVRDGHPDHGAWRFTWMLPVAPTATELVARIALLASLTDTGDEADVHADDVVIKEIAEINWLAHSYRGFQPFHVGRFYLYGHHHQETPIPDNTIPILIDAVTAFGSGEHPTTRGCLHGLDDLHADGFAPHNVLDLGTGTGILGIAAWKLWACPVMAVDIDRESVKVACEYRRYNNVPAGVKGMLCKQAATPVVGAVKDRGPYDLIIANILAAPLRVLAPDIALVATPNARLLLSGILDNQMDDVVAAYEPLGFKKISYKQIDDWVAINLVRAP